MSYRTRKRSEPLKVVLIIGVLAVGGFLLARSCDKEPEPPQPSPSSALATALPQPTPVATEPLATAEPAESVIPSPDCTDDPARVVMHEIPDLGRPIHRSREEALESLKRLSPLDSRITDILEDEDRYSDHLLSALSNNLELLDFAYHYTGPTDQATGGFTAAELKEEYPLLLQWDSRWGNVQYGSGPIALTGCGPVCLSMAALTLTGNASATPDQVAAYSIDHGYYTRGAGTNWTLISEGAAAYGLESRELPLWESSFKSALDAGEVLICCVRAGDFTTEGHFILLWGYHEEGFRVHDPNSTIRSGRLWTFADLKDQISNIWALKEAENVSTSGL